ncbi:MAG: DM13 domain-containing protein [Geminicoccaceae bacterium]|nr:DM13 domain-containing protein [Geminicoccaceae bacterium]
MPRTAFLTLALLLAACAAERPTAAPSATTATVGSPTLALGRFRGASGHGTAGTARIASTKDGYVLELGPDFAFDGAPDPRLGFGNDGTYDPASDIGPLRSTTGYQAYPLPADFDPGKHGEVYVWCRKYGVPLGVAPLDG